MTRPAMLSGNRGPNNSGVPSEFLKEESYRGALLPSRFKVMPSPTFVQPENGTQTGSDAISLDLGYNPTTKRMKSGNVTTDLSGGLY